MSMTGVCVGLGFVVNPDASLGLNGPRSVAWPYGSSGSCAIASANGLRIDTVAGNLWAEPPDIHTYSSASATGSSGTITSSYTDAGVGSISINNPDPCRPALVIGELRVTVTASTVAAGSGLTVNGDVYPTSGVSPGSQPVRFYRPNQSTTGAQQVVGTVTLPWQATLTAGQTGAVFVGSFSFKTDSGTSPNPGVSSTWSYEIMTYRSSW